MSTIVKFKASHLGFEVKLKTQVKWIKYFFPDILPDFCNKN
jgi:hypothetical protein